MSDCVVTGAFDDLLFRDFRFLEEASKRGPLHVLLWSDRLTGKTKFPQAEREYLLRANRFVHDVQVVDSIPDVSTVAIPDDVLNQMPPPSPTPIDPPSRTGKKVIVTGCYDWFHSGHVRFFEECADLGDLY